MLEPIDEIQVRVPEEFLGDVMGDLSSRARQDPRHRVRRRATRSIKALVPGSELYKYAAHLRSITQGRGMHSAKVSHYEEVPREISRQGDRRRARAEKEASAHA